MGWELSQTEYLSSMWSDSCILYLVKGKLLEATAEE
jgi:hypothetical protein